MRCVGRTRSNFASYDHFPEPSFWRDSWTIDRFAHLRSAHRFIGFLIAALIVFSAVPATADPQAPTCGTLAGMRLSNGMVSSAQQTSSLPASDLVQGRGPLHGKPDPQQSNLPPFCRLLATLSPVAGSRIGVEIWLPDQWNGKLLAVGNHGFAGEYERGYLAMGLHRGYAVAATDTGHFGPFLNLGGLSVGSAAFANGNPVALDDFAWRAIHELTIAAKEVVSRAYGRPARRAYFAGCSNGGREAMREAQQFPHDYDGILAGGAAMDWTRISAVQMRGSQLGDLGGGHRITTAKLQLAERAAIAACDTLDGLRDGFIANPSRCRWQPRTIQCRPGEDRPDCLSAAEVIAVSGMTAPLVDPKTRQTLYPGFAPGGEGIWAGAIGSMSEASPIMIDYYRFFVFNDASWTPEGVNVIDLLRQSERSGSYSLSVNATNPDLSAFERAGGKLIMYHGWRDEAMPPAYATQYYETVVGRQAGADKSARIGRYFRLFMVPGLNHCYGGEGPVNFGGLAQEPSSAVDPDHDILEALDRWVEHGRAPEKLIATTYTGSTEPRRQMPLCPYPQTAAYVGGDPNRAESFACRVPVAASAGLK